MVLRANPLVMFSGPEEVRCHCSSWLTFVSSVFS
jgi:hypothetical protein